MAYRKLKYPGEWSLSCRWLSKFHRPALVKDIYPDGTVYRVWFCWAMFKLMVKA